MCHLGTPGTPLLAPRSARGSEMARAKRLKRGTFFRLFEKIHKNQHFSSKMFQFFDVEFSGRFSTFFRQFWDYLSEFWDFSSPILAFHIKEIGAFFRSLFLLYITIFYFVAFECLRQQNKRIFITIRARF